MRVILAHQRGSTLYVLDLGIKFKNADMVRMILEDGRCSAPSWLLEYMNL